MSKGSNVRRLAIASELQRAADLIDVALRRLDISKRPCPHCQAALWNSPIESRVQHQFKETAAKLRAAAEKLTAIAAGYSSPGYDTAVTPDEGLGGGDAE